MACSIPRVMFSNGHSTPIIGLGTWKSKPGQVVQAVKDAIDLGYRHIDCAFFYKNEKEVGEGVACKISENIIKREDIFITSKLWNTYHRPDLVQGAFMQTLCDLGLDYLDLYLMHWPMAYKEFDNLVPKREGKTLYSNVDFVDTWKAMEEIAKQGYVSSLGVSNFNRSQLERLLKCACIPPVTNQVECHPYLNQKRLIEFCTSKGITVTAYSPLGSFDRPWAKKDEPVLLKDCTIISIGKKYNKTPAQIVLRYQVQKGVVVIPKSVNKSRIKENMEIFDFEICCEDMYTLDCLNRNRRYVSLSEEAEHPDYPFKEDSRTP